MAVVALPVTMTMLLGCIVFLLAMCAEAVPEGPCSVRIDPRRRQQTFEGWGTSLCWWANAIGRWSDDGKKTQIMDLVFDAKRGLGLNIVRYNVGGGESPIHDHMWSWRAIPGFRPDAKGPYDWEADAGQRWVLLESIKRGVTIAEAFANSPPWWMTISGSVTGSGEQRPAKSNLREDMYDAFADYLTEVVREYRDRYGVVFDTLTPLNEPSAIWWTFGNNQEGCRFSLDRQPAILRKTAEALARKGLETKLSAPEEYSIDETAEAWQAYDAATRRAVHQINTHSYAGEGREALRELAREAGKRVYVSEYGNGVDGEFGSALELVRVISLDVNELQCAGWVYWQAVGNRDEPTDWHAIDLSYSQRDEILTKKQYWGLMHFTRHIRPGSTILGVSAPDVVAALSPDGALALVVTNRETCERPITFDLSGFSALAGEAEWFRTTEAKDYERRQPVRVRGKALSAEVAPRSINTFVVEASSEGKRSD